MPNQGIRLSFRNASLMALLAALILGAISWALRSQAYAVTISLLMAITAASLFGAATSPSIISFA